MAEPYGFDRLSESARKAVGQLGLDPDSHASVVETDELLLVAYEAGAEIVSRGYAAGAWREPLDVTASLPKRTDDECWSQPRLVIGSDGLPWLFYLSEIRRTTYYHRWLGEDWGGRFRGRTIFHAKLIELLCAQ